MSRFEGKHRLFGVVMRRASHHRGAGRAVLIIVVEQWLLRAVSLKLARKSGLFLAGIGRKRRNAGGPAGSHNPRRK